MKTKIVEVTNNNQNWGKFLLGRFDSEAQYRSKIGHSPLLRSRGWDDKHILILDLETGEGALLRPGGLVSADLDKHKIWVCPMYEPFLEYLWDWVRKGGDPFDVPDLINLPDAEFAFYGYRRPGDQE